MSYFCASNVKSKEVPAEHSSCITNTPCCLWLSSFYYYYYYNPYYSLLSYHNFT